MPLSHKLSNMVNKDVINKYTKFEQLGYSGKKVMGYHIQRERETLKISERDFRNTQKQEDIDLLHSAVYIIALLYIQVSFGMREYLEVSVGIKYRNFWNLFGSPYLHNFLLVILQTWVMCLNDIESSYVKFIFNLKHFGNAEEASKSDSRKRAKNATVILCPLLSCASVFETSLK